MGFHGGWNEKLCQNLIYRFSKVLNVELLSRVVQSPIKSNIDDKRKFLFRGMNDAIMM